MSDPLRTESVDANRDRGYLEDVSPAQVDDQAVGQNLGSTEDEQERGTDAAAAREG